MNKEKALEILRKPEYQITLVELQSVFDFLINYHYNVFCESNIQIYYSGGGKWGFINDGNFYDPKDLYELVNTIQDECEGH